MQKQNDDKPHAERRGRLKNNNPSGDFSKAPRCQARTRSGNPCKAPAMKNGRCRLHGGKSTGPKTEEGKKRIGSAHLKHGRYTKEAVVARNQFRELLKVYKHKLHGLREHARQS